MQRYAVQASPEVPNLILLMALPSCEAVPLPLPSPDPARFLSGKQTRAGSHSSGLALLSTCPSALVSEEGGGTQAGRGREEKGSAGNFWCPQGCVCTHTYI